MIIYEITATASADLAEQYEKYMRETHIPDLLATGFFSGARIARAGENRYRIQYEARDRQALDEYLATEAARLRADFMAHFAKGIEVTRENWDVLQSWSEE
ncbi:MAG TPA: DUF4286 family protein [Pyrinomonadaceae bacterium]|jgi:hypothetical protein